MKIQTPGGEINVPDPGERPGRAPLPAPAPATPAAPTASPETPTDVGGSEPPPSSAGDESPDASFPVPPVPPPPAPGPTFALAGSGGGGAASFARPGTEAAKPFRSSIFTSNRGTAAPQTRFGAGAPVTGGASPAPFLPAGLEGDAGAAPGAPGDELARILAMMRGGGAGA